MNLGELGKAENPPPETKLSTFIQQNKHKCLSGDTFHFQGEEKLTLGGLSVAVNPCTLLNRTQLTAQILFLKDTTMQHFNGPKIFFFYMNKF